MDQQWRGQDLCTTKIEYIPVEYQALPELFGIFQFNGAAIPDKLAVPLTELDPVLRLLLYSVILILEDIREDTSI